MEKLLDPANGPIALITFLALHLVIKIVEFLWAFKEKKDLVTESGIEKLSQAVQQNTWASEKLEARIKQLEHTLGVVDKLQTDMRKAFIAIKSISGDNWPKIREEIMEEGVPN